MDKSVEILSELTTYMKYARYLPEKKRRETWAEIVERNKLMHIKKYPHLKEEIEIIYNEFVLTRKVLPSMRSMQFAGPAIEVNPVRLYNCSFTLMNDPASFWETMFLLLSGTGVGYSVQKSHVRQLPSIHKPDATRRKRFLVPDEIEGWSQAVRMLVESYFYGKREVDFDFRSIRPKGAELVTSGGKAPGPEPLRDALVKIKSVFENALQERGDGAQLKPIEVHDIQCHQADAVLAGGIRRAAMISLFSLDDYEMLESKSGTWWELNPQRGRANNTAVALRNKIDKDTFLKVWKRVEASGAGEPGVMFSDNPDWGLNPCAEISLRGDLGGGQFCNLTTINASDIVDQEDLNNRAKAASFIGTLQAGYTDFHYLRPEWREVTEKEALVGVSMTGIASNSVKNLSLVEASNMVLSENERVANLIGINKASRTTAIKPEGTASIILGTSSGIHAWHNDYYLRRVRVGKNEALYSYLSLMHPELVEDEFFRPETQAVITVPQKAPKGATLRTESALETLARVKRFNVDWVQNGHRDGDNYNNVSCTISLKDDEWEPVGEWMWNNRESYTAISVLPFDGGSYIQAPFTDCTEEEYTERMKSLSTIDLTQVVEESDQTNLQGEVACGGGGCEVT